eukprot:scaffold499_cov335-Pavlova_lutheri.AAC.30
MTLQRLPKDRNAPKQAFQGNGVQGPSRLQAVWQTLERLLAMDFQAIKVSEYGKDNTYGPDRMSVAFLCSASPFMFPKAGAANAKETGSLFLMRGTFEGSIVEKQEHTLYDANHAELGHGFGAFVGRFRRLLLNIAAYKGLDDIVIDVRPNIGMANPWIVNSADSIVPPCFPDSFSLQSMWDLIMEILPRFQATQKRWYLEGEATRESNSENLWLPRRFSSDFHFYPVTRLFVTLGKQICLSPARYIHRIEDLLDCVDNYPADVLERIVPYTKNRSSERDMHHVTAWIRGRARFRAGRGSNRARASNPPHPNTVEEWHPSHPLFFVKTGS